MLLLGYEALSIVLLPKQRNERNFLLYLDELDSEMRTQNMREKTNCHEGQVLNCLIKKKGQFFFFDLTRTISDCEA